MGNLLSAPEAPTTTPSRKDRDCWRKIDWTTRESLLQKTRGYTTGIDVIPKVNVLLVGTVGSGKSSVFNTIDSAFKERVSTVAGSKNKKTQSSSITKQYKVYKPGGRHGCKVSLNFCDTMGMELGGGLDVEDIVYILDGKIPDGFKFDPNKRITAKDAGFKPLPKVADRIHCVAIIVDGSKLRSVSMEEKKRLKRIGELAGDRDLALVVLVTHIDEVCELVKKDLRMAHQSVAVREVIEYVHQVSAVNMTQIFAVKNYTEELENDNDIDVLMLTALKKIVDFADDYLDKYADDE